MTCGMHRVVCGMACGGVAGAMTGVAYCTTLCGSMMLPFPEEGSGFIQRAVDDTKACILGGENNTSCIVGAMVPAALIGGGVGAFIGGVAEITHQVKMYCRRSHRLMGETP